MALSKELLRKMHGLPDPVGMADPAVLARRKYQDAAAKWLGKYSLVLSLAPLFTGAVVVVLPAVWGEWRSVIESVPIVGNIFHDFSKFSGMALIALCFVVLLGFVRNLLVNDIPRKGVVGLSYQDIVDMDVFPRTKKEEFAYWVDFVANSIGYVIWVFFVR